MFEKLDGSPLGNDDVEDVKLIVAMKINGDVEKVLDLPLLDFRYSWSSDMTQAIIAFCKWHTAVGQERDIFEGSPMWHKYSAVIDRLKDMLEGGYRKRAEQERHRRHHARRVLDLQRIKGFPPMDTLKGGHEFKCCNFFCVENVFGCHVGHLDFYVSSVPDFQS